MKKNHCHGDTEGTETDEYPETPREYSITRKLCRLRELWGGNFSLISQSERSPEKNAGYIHEDYAGKKRE